MDGYLLSQMSICRHNLQLEVIPVACKDEKISHLSAVLGEYPNDQTIIYALNKESCDELVKKLNMPELRQYHGGMTTK